MLWSTRLIKYHAIFVVTVIFLALIPRAGAQQDVYPVAAGPYLEQQSLAGSLLSEHAVTGDSLTLTYIANMGVLVTSADSKVMIDCLFDGPTKGYFPASETLDSMMNGIPPFDGVDLVLVTHKDRDHFDSAVAVHYMETRSEPILVVPADAAEKMRSVGSDWDKIESRVVIIDLEIGETLKMEAENVPVTVLRTTHGTSRRPMNLMYLIEVNGWRVFHEGDASGKADDYLAFGLDTVHFDLAIMQCSWPTHPHRPYRLFFQNEFKADHIALAHVNIGDEGDAESRTEDVRKYYNDIFVLLPGLPTKIFRR